MKSTDLCSSAPICGSQIDPLKFDRDDEITVINAHAPEIFQDEVGNWYISSVEWPHRGVSIARLAWE